MIKIKDLTTFADFEKKIETQSKLKKISNNLEAEYLLAKSLIELRFKRKISQSGLASKIGTKQPVISRLENMSSRPTLTLLQKIATALNAELRITFK